MGASARSDRWDAVWAEFDARQARSGISALASAGGAGTRPPKDPLGRLRRLVRARRSQPGAGPRPFPEASAGHLRAAEPARRQLPPKRDLGRFKRILAVLACALGAVYAGSPVASAVQLAAAIQRGDAAALAHHIDWNTLRPALSAALAAETQRNSSAPMPDFITGMAQDMAERLASPAGLAVLLNERLAAGGSQPARDMLSRVRLIEAGLWEVTLTSVNLPERSATLTLALTDPMRLRWEVQAIQFPPQLAARPR